MGRTLTCLASLLALLAGPLLSADAPTHFRKRHTIVLYAKEGESVSATIGCLSASRGYSDKAAYYVLNPFGRLLTRGVVPVSEKRVVEFVAKTAGPYIIDVDPGMNAFTIEPSMELWAVDISDRRRLNVIDHARSLYFWVPKRTTSFTLKMQGEPGEVAVCDGTGAVVKRESLPLYKPVDVALDVPEGKAGCAWHLKLDLREDQGIVFPGAFPPYVAERPLTQEMLDCFKGGPGLTRFDLQITPRHGLVLSTRPQVEQRLQTQDALGLGLAGAGQVADVRVDGKSVMPADQLPAGGFFVKDVAAGPGLVPVQSTFERIRSGLRQTGKFPTTNVSLRATYAAKPDHIAISGVIEDATGKDRAISLYFALPVAAAGVEWWDTIDQVRPVEGTNEYGYYSAARVGANGKSSVYPFGSVAGIALAIPLDRPCINRIAYNAATRQLYTVFDFALTPATKKFPGRAAFSFVIYSHDARWGLRAAAKKYYGIFPHLVEKRMKRDGGWVCWGSVAGIENISDFGFLYHWGPGGASAVAHDDKIAIYSFLYNDSVRFFADLGTFPKRPDAAARTEVFKTYLSTADPRAFVLSRPAKATGRRRYEGLERSLGREAASAYLRRCVDAVRKSAAHNRDGDFIVGYVIDRKDWGPPNWWTGRLFCNPDPDIPGGYGQFLLNEIIGRTFADYRNAGGELDGVGLDNYFVYSRDLNFRREHFAYVDYALTFSTGELRPVQVGDFALYEWVEAMARKFRAEGKWIMANMGVLPFPFAANLLDMHGYEWNIERVAPAARTLAYRKPVVTLPVKPDHYTEPWIRKHVRFGIFPGGYGGSKKFSKEPKLRAIYKKYVPVIQELAKAGWEPVTFAATDADRVRIERFGSRGATPMYFTVDNPGEDEATCTLRIEAKDLGLSPAALRVSARLCGELKAAKPADDELLVSLVLPAKSTSVLVIDKGESGAGP